MIRLAADIEGNGFLDSVDKIWCLGIEDIDTGEYVEYAAHTPAPLSLEDGFRRLQEADVFGFHNGVGYDLPAIAKVHGVVLPREKLRDTMVLSRLIDPELQGHSIEDWGERLGEPKGSHDDFTCYSPEMSRYMRRDVSICARLMKKFLAVIDTWGPTPLDHLGTYSPFYVWLEHETAHWIARQMDYGFAFDVRGAQELASTFDAELMEMRHRIQREICATWFKPGKTKVSKVNNAKFGYTAGVPYTPVTQVEFNPGSGQQIADYLKKKYNWKPKAFTESGLPKVDEDVLRELGWPETVLLADYAKLEKKWGQIASPPKQKKDGTKKGGGWMFHVKPTARIHGYVNSNGAVTGRMTHSNPNSANIDKDERLRALYIASPGKVLVGCDADGLELRMLGHYLAMYDGGEYARAVVHGKKEDETDAHSRTRKIVQLFLRDSAKTFIYAMIYGGGDPKLGLIIKQDAAAAEQPIPGGSQKALGVAARARIFDQFTGYSQLVKAVKKRAKLQGWIKGLDGRRVKIRKEYSALNTLLQGAGALVMKLALVLTAQDLSALFGPHGQRWGLVANVHDEWQIECDPDIAEAVGEISRASITKAGELFQLRCPLAGSYAIGANWSETH
jgi:DNA polymerase-1